MKINCDWEKCKETGSFKAPVENDKWGAQSFPGLLHQLKPDLVWTLADTYMIEHIGALKPKFGYKYVQYMPIDGTPTPQRYKKIN